MPEEVNKSALKFFLGIDTMWSDFRALIRDVIHPNGTVRHGWGDVMDVATAPKKWLPWLGQFVGVTISPKVSEEQARAEIKELAGFKRGTLEAITNAGKRTLTGSKRVHIIERWEEHAYRILILTFVGETPNPAETKKVFEEALPAGIFLVYEDVPIWIYEELRETGKTYKGLKEEYAPVDYEHLVLKKP